MKRLTIALTILACSAAFCFAWGTKEASKEPMTLRVGAIKGPTGIGMIHLFEQAPALPQQVEASFEALAGAEAAAARLLSGELDAAVLPVNLAAKMYNAGLGYRMVALVGNGMVELLTNDAGIQGPKDLTGREVFVAGQGATPEFLLRTVLKHAGMDPDKDLRLSFSMPYPEMAAALASGRISLAVLPQPFVTVAKRANPALRQAFSLDSLWQEATGQDDYPMTVFVVKASVIEDRPDAVRALMAAYEASIRSAIADPAAAGALVEKHDFGLKAPVAAAAIPESNYVFMAAPEARAMIEALLSVFLESAPASIGGKLPNDGFYAELGR